MKTRLEMKDGVAHLLLDDPDKKVNTLGGEMVEEISSRLDELAGDGGVKAVVIRSPKPTGFLAGADIDELKSIALSPQAEEGGTRASRRGQALMDKVEDFPKPVVAAVHGPCLGGGLELALAAQARVAGDDPSTRLGLPELKLGILPGFGGTYRLPRLVGLVGAMEAILASKTFEARQALKRGLVDEVAAVEQLPGVAGRLALSLLQPSARGRLLGRRHAALPLGQRLMGAPGLKSLAVAKARKQVVSRTGTHYPAPLEFLELLSSRLGSPRAAHLDAEARALGRLLATPVAANLIRLFFLGQDAKRQVKGAKGARVERAGIIGSGFMGSAIAIPLADKAGLPVALKDTSESVLGRALKKGWDFESGRARRRQVSRLEAERRFHLFSPSLGWEGFSRVDVAIEAVPEILDLKRSIMAEAEAAMRPDAVIASNTSTLPITSLAEGARHPERIVGMHFFSPAERMPLVEVIPGGKSSPQALATVVDLALRMGKTPVVVADRPGFLVNRILFPYLLESLLMLEEGIPVARVDKAAVDFGMPLGPVKLIAEVGVEVTVKAGHVMLKAFGDHLAAPRLMERPDFAQAFAKGPDGKARVNPAMISQWVGKPDPGIPDRDIQDRLFVAMILEGLRCLKEGIVAEAGMLDLAMVFGTGFPPFRGGLMREADRLGAPALLQRCRELAAQYGPRFQPLPELEEKAQNGGRFCQA